MDASQRIKAIQDALNDFVEATGIRRDVTIRGQRVSVRVVSLDPRLLLLNHDNFRIHSQLEDSAKRDVVFQDPSGAEAQKIIEDLLAATKEFKGLKEQLKEYGQQEPGLISYDGLLVNGNTRAVALRQLNSAGMLVGVLPKSANGKDLLLIQSDLQMQRWIHQDYSFTNELLFLEELKDTLGLENANIVKRLGWKSGRASEKKLEKKFRLLRIIRDVRASSEKPVPYSFFDDKQQILEDLDADYEKAKEFDFEIAENLKRLKLVAMVRGLTKDQVRIIDEEWVEPQDSKGDSVIPKPEENELGKVINERFDDQGRVKLPDDPEEVEKAKQQRAKAENQIAAERIKNILGKPQDLLEDATKKINDLLIELSDLADDGEFDKAKFLESASKLQASYEKLSGKLAELGDEKPN
jgi:hypothetical protein